MENTIWYSAKQSAEDCEQRGNNSSIFQDDKFVFSEDKKTDVCYRLADFCCSKARNDISLNSSFQMAYIKVDRYKRGDEFKVELIALGI